MRIGLEKLKLWIRLINLFRSIKIFSLNQNNIIFENIKLEFDKMKEVNMPNNQSRKRLRDPLSSWGSFYRKEPYHNFFKPFCLDLNKQELQSRRLSAMRKIECPRWSPMRFSRIFKGKGQSWASRAVHVKPANCLHHIVSANKQASIETWERDWMMQCKNTTYTETCFISYKRNELLYKSAD